jgi:hypothetical protein
MPRDNVEVEAPHVLALLLSLGISALGVAAVLGL